AQKNLQHLCFLQANELAQNDEWEEALRIWQNVCSRDDLNVFYNIALAYDKLENPQRANLHWQKITAYYEELCRNNPDDILKKEYLGIAYQHLIKNYQDIGDDKRAIRTLEKLCKLKPEDTTCQFELAETYLDNERWNSAQQQFSKILSQDPKNVDALIHLAFVQDMQYKEQQAIQTLEKALQIEPDSIEAKHQLAALLNEEAIECLNSDDYKKAGELFKRQIELDPSDFAGYHGLAYIYSEYLDNLKTMKLIFQGYISTNPGDAEVYIDVANAFYEFDQPKKAMLYYQKAEELAAGNAELFIDIGMKAYNFSERKAEKFFKKAIELAPGNADIYFKIASSYLRRDPWKAKKYFGKCLKINKNYYQAHLKLAYLETMEGHQAVAGKHLLLAKQIAKSAEKGEELAIIEDFEKTIGEQMDLFSELPFEDE
ncbi:MAG: tetratricopeptide repeat protein, partial [Calditrichaeota bacterium]|nr:tetratricopeptide repeat protein [Calditrichota bacterium]